MFGTRSSFHEGGQARRLSVDRRDIVMSRSKLRMRLLASGLLAGTAGLLGGCSSNSASHFDSDYVSPIAATPAPQPIVPVSSTGGPAKRSMPLLPPVPGEEASHGLPPVSVASLLPPER